MERSEVTQEYLKTIFAFKEGRLYWKVSPNWSIKVGAKAGTLNKGYLRTIFAGGLKMYNHQIIFLMEKGYLPEVIDHIDGNRLNNELSNLREVTDSQNASNRKVHSNNQSGYKGVSVHRQTGKYQAEIQVRGNQIYIGLYDEPKDAAQAYNDKAVEHFGEYAKTNII